MLKRLFLLIIFIVLVNYLYADNWHILNEGSHGNINSIDFVNQTTGWAAGFNGLLLKTEDGGETWTNLVYKEGAQIYIIDFVTLKYQTNEKIKRIKNKKLLFIYKKNYYSYI